MSETRETIQPIDLVAARELCAKATNGPWISHDQNWNLIESDGSSLLEIQSPWNDPTPEFINSPDAAFCAQARTLLPQAISEIERLRQDVEYYRRALRVNAGYKAEAKA